MYCRWFFHFILILPLRFLFCTTYQHSLDLNMWYDHISLHFHPPPTKKKKINKISSCRHDSVFSFLPETVSFTFKSANQPKDSKKKKKSKNTLLFYKVVLFFFVLSYVSQEFLTHVFHYQTCLNGKAQAFLYFCYSFLYFMFQYREYKHWQMKQLWCLCYDTELILDTKTLRGNGPFKSPW